jgi:hypothetical protein
MVRPCKKERKTERERRRERERERERREQRKSAFPSIIPFSFSSSKSQNNVTSSYALFCLSTSNDRALLSAHRLHEEGTSKFYPPLHFPWQVAIK